MARFPNHRSTAAHLPTGAARAGRSLAVALLVACAAGRPAGLPAQDVAAPSAALAARIERAAAGGIVVLANLRADVTDLTELTDAFCGADLEPRARELARRTLFRGRHAALERLWHDDPARRAARADAFGALGTDFLVDAWLEGGAAGREAVLAAAGRFAASRYLELLREIRAAGPTDPRREALASLAREMVRTIDRQPIAALLAVLERDPPDDPLAATGDPAPALLLLAHHTRALEPDLPRGASARLAVLRREILAPELPLPHPLRVALLTSGPTDAAVAAARHGALDAILRARLLLRMQDADPSPGLALVTAALGNPRDSLDAATRLTWIASCIAAVEAAQDRLPPPRPRIDEVDPVVRFVAAAIAKEPEALVLTIQSADRIARAGDRAFACRLLARLDHAAFVAGRDVPRVAGATERMLRSDDPELAGRAASLAATLLCFRDFPPLREALVERAIECLERRRGDRAWLSGMSHSRRTQVFGLVPLSEDLPGDARVVEAAARSGGPGLVTPLLDLYQRFDGPTEPGAQQFILKCLGGVAHHATGSELDHLLATVDSPVGRPMGAPGADTFTTTILTGLYCAAPAERLDEIAARCRPSPLAPAIEVFRTLGPRSRHLTDAQRQRVLRWVAEEKSLPCFDELMLPETAVRAAGTGPLADAARERLARTCATTPEPVLALLRGGALDPGLLLDHLDTLPWPTIADLTRYVREPALRDRLYEGLARRLALSEPDATSAHLLSRTLPGFDELLARQRPVEPVATDPAILVAALASDRDLSTWDDATLARVVDLTGHGDAAVRTAAYAALATRDPVLYPEARLVAERALLGGD